MSDRLLREVSYEEWKNLPFDKSYAIEDKSPARASFYRYFEILDPEGTNE